MVESLENSEGFLSIEFDQHSDEVSGADRFSDLNCDWLSCVLAVVCQPEWPLVFIQYFIIVHLCQNGLTGKVCIVDAEVVNEFSELFEVDDLLLELVFFGCIPFLILFDEESVPEVIKSVN